MTYNVSARPLRIWVSATGYDPVGIDELPSDVDPIEIEPIMYGEPILDVNGQLIRKKKFVPVKVTISVIPGTPSEKSLSKLVYDEFVNSKSIPISINTDFEVCDNVDYGGNSDIPPDSFEGGYFIGASIGYSVSSRGCVVTKKYHFVFKNGNQ